MTADLRAGIEALIGDATIYHLVNGTSSQPEPARFVRVSDLRALLAAHPVQVTVTRQALTVVIQRALFPGAKAHDIADAVRAALPTLAQNVLTPGQHDELTEAVFTAWTGFNYKPWHGPSAEREEDWQHSQDVVKAVVAQFGIVVSDRPEETT